MKRRLLALILILCMALGMCGTVWGAETDEEWIREPDMLYGMSNSAAIIYNDSIYVFGGVYTGTSVQIFDFAANEWRLGASMPHSRMTRADVHLIKGKIYIMGGSSADFSSGVAEVDIYDPKTDTWSSGTDFPVAIQAGTSCAVGTKIYCIGGLKPDGYCNEVVYIYDTASDTWEESDTAAPFQRYYVTSAAVGKDIYVLGGAGTIDSLFIYHTDSDTWDMRTTNTRLERGFDTCVVGEVIYLIPGDYYNAPHSRTVLTYDPKEDSWTRSKDLPHGQDGCSAVERNGRLYIIGCVRDDSNGVKMYSLKIAEPSDTKHKLSVLLNPAEQVQLSVSFDLAHNADYAWTSTNEAAATVDANGKVTAVAPGEADIYAESSDGAFREYIPVKVADGIADELRLAVHLSAGQKAKLYLTDDPSTVTWNSMDETVAAVSGSGEVTAVKKGLCIVQGEINGEAYNIYVRVV